MRKQRIHHLKKRRVTKRVTGGALSLSTRRRRGANSSSSRRSSSTVRSRSSMSAYKKMLNIRKYVTILNKMADSKAMRKKDPNAGYLLIPFVDSYAYSNSIASSSQSISNTAVRGGGVLRAAASIATEPEAAAPSERNIAELLERHGRTHLGVHGPCWWHRIKHYERLLFVRRCNPQLALQHRRRHTADGMCDFPEARPGSRAKVEACIRGADKDQNLALRYVEPGIPASRAASASRLPARVASTLSPECVGEVYISQSMRFEHANIPVELARSMEYFAAQYRSYCPLVHNAVPVGLTGAVLTRIVSKALRDASARLPSTEQFRIPSNFDSPDTRLTFCEYAAIFFFTRDRMTPFSSYILLNNTMNYSSVKDITAAEYVQRIRHPFVMLFYFALYKCPRIRDIQHAGLTPPGMRHLHRFMTVDAGFFQTYQSLPVANLVTFYCFQSFSFTLAYNNVGPFTNYDPRQEYLILLRIEINDATSARLMSHFSELINENEAIVMPCVPYTVVGVQEFQASAGFEQEITAGSGYTHPHEFNDQFRGFLVVTIREERYNESMTGRAEVLRG